MRRTRTMGWGWRAQWGGEVPAGVVKLHTLVPVQALLRPPGVEQWIELTKRGIKARGNRAKTCHRSVKADNVDVEVIVITERRPKK